jgi:hypothetical protein
VRLWIVSDVLARAGLGSALSLNCARSGAAKSPTAARRSSSRQPAADLASPPPTTMRSNLPGRSEPKPSARDASWHQMNQTATTTAVAAAAPSLGPRGRGVILSSSRRRIPLTILSSR